MKIRTAAISVVASIPFAVLGGHFGAVLVVAPFVMLLLLTGKLALLLVEILFD